MTNYFNSCLWSLYIEKEEGAKLAEKKTLNTPSKQFASVATRYKAIA